ncbi:MAG: Fe-S cluster assembly protein SufD [Cyanobacteria bacterium SZAS LIN-5]|nr:Fe-S cluster assembly protein SufD [Cyanobacteria bacterium SZAS LIN-5]
MSESKSVNTIARERVDNLASQNGEPSWLKELRVSAWEAYLQTPMPTGRDEDWRKTDIESLDLSNLNAIDLSTKSDAKAKLPEWFETALTFFEDNSGVVAEVGQSSIPAKLPAELAAKGVIFCTLKEALRDHAELIRPYLSKIDCDQKFVLMNKALFNGGAFLYVPANVEVEGPFISLTHFTSSNGSPNGVAIFPRLIAVLGSHSKANLINIISSEPGTETKTTLRSLANALVEVHVAAGAKCEYLEIQKFDANVFAITRTHNQVEQDASVKSLTVALGGSQLKGDIATILNAKGATSDLQGIVLGDNDEHYSFNTIQKHIAPDTNSNINFRVALKGNAQSIYQGIIEVDKIAQKTAAFQSNKNLLLGNEARADSIPKLEILADDVKCSHGATVGPVDREQIFYLMSRGLSAPAAEELIVTGFFRQILEACTIGRAKDWVYDVLAEKIHGV